MKTLKKVVVALLVVTMLVPPVSTEAALKKSASNVMNLYKQGKYSQAMKMAEKLPKKANEQCVKKMSKKMKKAYLKKVKTYKTYKTRQGYGKYIWGYYFTDIDNDKKAEMIIQYGSCEADCMIAVYKYQNGKVVKKGSMGAGHTGLYAYPGKSGVVIFRAHMSQETISILRIKGGKLVLQEIGSRGVRRGGDYISLPYILDGHWSSLY